jgi:lipopolysaccharide heptosyltransferase I
MMSERILIVRLGSLGDIVHTLPVISALKRAMPHSQIDWIVDERNQAILELTQGLNRLIVLPTRAKSIIGTWKILRELRQQHYDAALDLQGLMKSAVVARVSGAKRIIGFSREHLRESAARLFYTEVCAPSNKPHVIDKNLSGAAALGADVTLKEFPISVPASAKPAELRSNLGLQPSTDYVLLNPGAAWPNKRWLPARFGELASWLKSHHNLGCGVLWGPGEQSLAEEVVAFSNGTAVIAPRTTIGDLVALIKDARLVVSGDTGPMHIAAAVETAIVGIYGPTDPLRNGPWAPGDLTISRFSDCGCHHRRRCGAAQWCLESIPVGDVIDAVEQRLQIVRDNE